MASRQYSGKKPQNLKKTLAFFLSYIGRHRLIFLAVAVMVAISAIANLARYLHDPAHCQSSGRWGYTFPADGRVTCCRDFRHRSFFCLGIHTDHGKGLSKGACMISDRIFLHISRHFR